MKKFEFLSLLEKEFQGLPKEDIKRTLDYYAEIIDDRIEDGADEETAVRDLGKVKDICNRIWSEASLPCVAKACLRRSRSLKAWEIALIILGSPVWLPVLLAIGVVILAAYVVLWSIDVSFYAVDVSLAGTALGGVILSIIYMTNGGIGGGLIWLGAALVLAGAAIFAFFGCHMFAKLLIFLTKKTFLGLKRLVVGRSVANEKC